MESCSSSVNVHTPHDSALGENQTITSSQDLEGSSWLSSFGPASRTRSIFIQEPSPSGCEHFPCPLDVIFDPPASAAYHMQKDAELIQTLQHRTKPLLRFYSWEEPSITYGHFIDPEILPKISWPKARRPTGGGILFHYCDFAFTLVYPASCPLCFSSVQENYCWVNEAVLEVVTELFPNIRSIEPSEAKNRQQDYCMATPTPFDVIISGIKIGGAAQRRTKWGFVHQSSLFLEPLPWQELEGFVEESLIQEMKTKSAFLSGYKKRAISREEIAQRLITTFKTRIS